MNISINLGVWKSVFAVPSAIVDEHIKIASELQIKLILFLLRNSEKSYSLEELSSSFSAHIDDIKDAVDFWVQRGILSFSGDSYVPNSNQDIKQPVTQIQVDTNETNVKPEVRTVYRPTKPDLHTASRIVANDEVLQVLLDEISIALSKNLSSGDTATIIMLYDNCSLPPEVILLLVNYCISIEKTSMRSIEKMGISWADDGVNTLELAENKINQIRMSTANWNFVSGIFGIQTNSSPTKKQLEYADLWVGQWHFSSDILRKAYEICVDNTNGLKMAYINKILLRWHNAGVVTLEDIEKLESQNKESKKSNSRKFKNSSYDIDELEKIQ